MKKTLTQIKAYIAKRGPQLASRVRYAEHEGALIVAFNCDMDLVSEEFTSDIMQIGRKNGVSVRPCGEFFGSGIKWL
jgi:hypothetical protein